MIRTCNFFKAYQNEIVSLMLNSMGSLDMSTNCINESDIVLEMSTGCWSRHSNSYSTIGFYMYTHCIV